MPIISLTAYGGAILGPIARVLGFVMNLIYQAMYYIFKTENVGLSIVLFTILIYTCILPFTYKQQKFSKMSAYMQPEINDIRNKYAGKTDNESAMAMNEETRAVYKKYGVSMSGNCIQMVVQMIILFALYRVFYMVPGYITMVRDNYYTLVDGILSIDFSSVGLTLEDAMSGLMSDFNISVMSSPDWSATGDTLRNYVVDVLYGLPSSGWDQLAEYFSTNFSADLSGVITSTYEHVQRFGYLFHFGSFQGLNISDAPFSIIRMYWSMRASVGNWFVYALVALLIPICSFASQMLSIMQMPQPEAAEGDQTANSMRMMNRIMPIFSLVMCFFVSTGLGIYWVTSALYRCIQQFFLNRHFAKEGVQDIVAKQQVKAEKKKEKKNKKAGISEEKIREASRIRTRNINRYADVSSADQEQKKQQLQKADEIKSHARTDSMAARANMVKDFNERNSRK